MKLERKFYEIQLTRLELEMILEALVQYTSMTENMTDTSFPEPKELAKEISELKKKQDAK